MRTAIPLLHGATEFKISLPSSMFRPSLRRCALRPQHVPRRWNTSPVKPSILGEPVALTAPIAPQPYQPIGDALPKPPTWRPIFVRVYYIHLLFCHLTLPTVCPRCLRRDLLHSCQADQRRNGKMVAQSVHRGLVANAITIQ